MEVAAQGHGRLVATIPASLQQGEHLGRKSGILAEQLAVGRLQQPGGDRAGQKGCAWRERCLRFNLDDAFGCSGGYGPQPQPPALRGPIRREAVWITGDVVIDRPRRPRRVVPPPVLSQARALNFYRRPRTASAESGLGGPPRGALQVTGPPAGSGRRLLRSRARYRWGCPWCRTKIFRGGSCERSPRMSPFQPFSGGI